MLCPNARHSVSEGSPSLISAREMPPPVPDIVHNSRLETEFHPEHTLHVQYQSGDTFSERRQRVEERWVHERDLGQGGHGRVHLERLLRDDGDRPLRAVKVLSKLPNYHRELEAIALFSHRKYRASFVESLGWYEDDVRVFIAMEFLPYGDLQRYLVKPLPEIEARAIITQLLEALTFMHQNHFAHRDLKPTNILVKCLGPSWWVKIADFGISKRAVNNDTALRTITGTPAFVAPEVFGFIRVDGMTDGYTTAVDIWSLGAITSQLLTTQIPFRDIGDLARYATGLLEFPLPLASHHGVSRQGESFVLQTMSVPPQSRPTTHELLQHPWMMVHLEADTLDQVPLTVTSTIPRHTDSSQEHSPTFPIPKASAAWTTPDLHRFVSNDQTNKSEVEDITNGLDVISINDAAQTKPESDNNTPFPSDRSRATHEAANSRYQEACALYDVENYLQAERIYRQAIDEHRESVGYNSEDTAKDLHLLGRTQYFLKKYPDAERSFRAAVGIRRKVLGFYCQDTAASLHWLGSTQWQLNNYVSTEQSLQAAFVIREKVLGHDHEDTARILLWLGRAQYELAKYLDAERSFENLCRIRQEALCLDQEHAADCRHWLGLTQFHLTKYLDAEESFQAAIRIYKKQLGQDSSEEIAYTLDCLGAAQYELAKYSDAERSFQNALRMNEKFSGHDHDDAAFSLRRLGETQYQLEKYADAERAFKAIYERNKKLLGHNHERTTASLDWLEDTRKQLKKQFDTQLSFQAARKVYLKKS